MVMGLFFIVRNYSFFVGIILCSSVYLVWNFSSRGVYKFIIIGTNIPFNLIPFFNDVFFLFCRFLKSGVINELKNLFLWKSKKVRVFYSKQCETLLLIKREFSQSIHGGLLQLHLFFKKRLIQELGSHFSQIR